MKQKKNQDLNMDDAFWLVSSRLVRYGILQYSYFRIDFQHTITTPAQYHADIIFVLSGGCTYEGIKVKQGDVFVHGMNTSPVTSISTDIELFSATVSHETIFRIFGMMPADYHEKALLLSKNHLLSSVLGQKLLASSCEHWKYLADQFWEEMINRTCEEQYSKTYDSVLYIAEKMRQKGSVDIEQCCHEFGISRRQLQRLFRRFFGITMQAYENLLRFTKAYTALSDHTLADTAQEAGYFDQSHMDRDFRKMAGNTPQVTSCQQIYQSLKETLQNQKK